MNEHDVIRVVCMAKQHAGRVAVVEIMERSRDFEDDWFPRRGDDFERPYGDVADVPTSPGGFVSKAQSPMRAQGSDHQRIKLRCPLPLCAQDVTVRLDRLQPVLSALWESGKGAADIDGALPVPLGLLAARVVSK